MKYRKVACLQVGAAFYTSVFVAGFPHTKALKKKTTRNTALWQKNNFFSTRWKRGWVEKSCFFSLLVTNVTCQNQKKTTKNNRLKGSANCLQGRSVLWDSLFLCTYKTQWKKDMFFVVVGDFLGGRDPLLVDGWWMNQPIWKMWVKLDHFPKDRGENKIYLKPPTN